MSCPALGFLGSTSRTCRGFRSPRALEGKRRLPLSACQSHLLLVTSPLALTVQAAGGGPGLHGCLRTGGAGGTTHVSAPQLCL